jgi:hypothetical protein
VLELYDKKEERPYTVKVSPRLSPNRSRDHSRSRAGTVTNTQKGVGYFFTKHHVALPSQNEADNHTNTQYQYTHSERVVVPER